MKEILIVFRKMYLSQITHAKERGQHAPTYTYEEFLEWLNNQPHLEKLWNVWCASNYDTKLKPSVDRIDETKSYTIENIQLITWEDNYRKAQHDRKTGKRLLTHKAVRALTVTGQMYGEYISIKEAARAVSGDSTKISNIVNKKICTKACGRTYTLTKHKNLLWEYI